MKCRRKLRIRSAIPASNQIAVASDGRVTLASKPREEPWTVLVPFPLRAMNGTIRRKAASTRREHWRELPTLLPLPSVGSAYGALIETPDLLMRSASADLSEAFAGNCDGPGRSLVELNGQKALEVVSQKALEVVSLYMSTIP